MVGAPSMMCGCQQCNSDAIPVYNHLVHPAIFGQMYLSAKTRVLRALWAGNVPRAIRVLQTQRRLVADPQALDDLTTYLQARAAWMPDYRARRRQRQYIGSGLAEKANDRIVVRRQKRRGMQWGAESRVLSH